MKVLMGYEFRPLYKWRWLFNNFQYSNFFVALNPYCWYVKKIYSEVNTHTEYFWTKFQAEREFNRINSKIS